MGRAAAASERGKNGKIIVIMSEDHFDEYEHYNYDQEKNLNCGHGGKQQTRRRTSTVGTEESSAPRRRLRPTQTGTTRADMRERRHEVNERREEPQGEREKEPDKTR